MNRTLGAWSAVGFFVFWLFGFVAFAQWVPPVEPSDSAAEVAAEFRDRDKEILVAMVFMGTGAALYLPWTAVLADLIKEIQGRSNFLYGTQLAAGAMSAMTFFIPALLWAAAAFRPERDPEITQALNDLGWLMFITPIAPFILQYLTLAVAIFADKRAQPAYPRWAGYLQIWVSLTFLPGLAAYFTKTGPLAWNGIFVWWIPFVAFTAWFACMIVLTRKAVLIERPEQQDSSLVPNRS